ncbi:hypothetical protein F5Y11DRAFT_92801 [Daldinia sp. FL1419]|nr:hypothetical protein F5Y11DRAFT_92801 [Daldinia sp. FL1419]
MKSVHGITKPSSISDLRPTSILCFLPSTCPQANTKSSARVHLEQLDPDKKEVDTDIDIIAIHGFDTQSAGTWKDRKTGLNWLYNLCLG